jgi:hypothetical protein
MIKKNKIIFLINVIFFTSFLLLEVYHFYFEYSNYMNLLSFSHPCSISLRIIPYMLSLIIISASFNFLYNNRGLLLILFANIAFLLYQIVVLFVLSSHCFMSFYDRMGILHIYLLIQIVFLLFKRYSINKLKQK